MKKETVEIKYVVELNESQVKKLLNLAKEYGLDYNDAGPMETLKRILIENGTAALAPDIEPMPVKHRRL